MNMSKELIAVIAEGESERAVIDVLLDHEALTFDRREMLQEEIITTRKGANFAKMYLNKSFSVPIKIIRILDSRKENFKLPKVYQRKISEINNVTMRPEIEILYIIYHNDFQYYTNGNNDKPSKYVRSHYKDLEHVKTYEDNYQFWDNHFDDLIKALKQYKSYHKKELAIADLLK
ncbi:N-6 DNA methylase [Lactobacillus sp. PV012]|nr:N-6 DNA methylase [Lactobacillus sp. PV012]